MTVTDAVEEAVAELRDAGWDRELDTVVFVVEDAHPQRLRGSYHGVPLPQRAFGVVCVPSTITLYADRFIGGGAGQVRMVVRHEFGHHVGLSDVGMDRAIRNPVSAGR